MKIGKYNAENVVRCPICGTVGSFIFDAPTLDVSINFDVHNCPNCNCTYNDPRMTESEMVRFYQSGDYIKRTLKKRNGRDNFGERNRALRLMMIMMNMTNLFHSKIPSRCLDVGCSQGHLLERMKDFWYEVETVGYDVYKDPKAIREVVTDRNEIEGKFDLITCIHVLEHTYDPMAELEWMESLLSEDGTLVLELPIVRYIMLEHPITFAVDTVPVMMERIGFKNFTTMDCPKLESCIVFAKR